MEMAVLIMWHRLQSVIQLVKNHRLKSVPL
jgi:hypothetical protein